MNVVTFDFSSGDLKSNFWSTEWANNGIMFCVIKNRVFHILMPIVKLLNGQSIEETLLEMQTGSKVIISKRNGAYMFMFDDNTESPFALLLDARQFSTLPAQTDNGRKDVKVKVHLYDGNTFEWPAEIHF